MFYSTKSGGSSREPCGCHSSTSCDCGGGGGGGEQRQKLLVGKRSYTSAIRSIEENRRGWKLANYIITILLLVVFHLFFIWSYQFTGLLAVDHITNYGSETFKILYLVACIFYFLFATLWNYLFVHSTMQRVWFLNYIMLSLIHIPLTVFSFEFNNTFNLTFQVIQTTAVMTYVVAVYFYLNIILAYAWPDKYVTTESIFLSR